MEEKDDWLDMMKRVSGKQYTTYDYGNGCDYSVSTNVLQDYMDKLIKAKTPAVPLTIYSKPRSAVKPSQLKFLKTIIDMNILNTSLTSLAKKVYHDEYYTEDQRKDLNKLREIYSLLKSL